MLHPGTASSTEGCQGGASESLEVRPRDFSKQEAHMPVSRSANVQSASNGAPELDGQYTSSSEQRYEQGRGGSYVRHGWVQGFRMPSIHPITRLI